MDVIKAFCPRCEKVYRISTEELQPGEPQFQCQACEAHFALRWPQPPGTDVAATFLVTEKGGKERSNFSGGSPSISPLFTPAEATPRLVRPNSTLKVDSPSPDLSQAWEAVKKDYGSSLKHEGFIQLCLGRDALAYASHVYRQILSANPAEPIAKSAQEKIIQLATSRYFGSEEVRRRSQAAQPGRLGFISVFFITGGMLIVLGLAVKKLVGLVAFGVALCVFGLVIRFMRRPV